MPQDVPTEGLAIRTQAEVAEIMTARGLPMSRQRVVAIERKAIEKLLHDPGLRMIAEFFGWIKP